MSKLEDAIESLRFDENGLIPAIVQDDSDGAVLMMAWMNRESLAATLETGLCTYWSRSRSKLWVKGETSGHFQRVKRISVDCDSDTLLVRVEQTGAACHENYRSCFFRDLAEHGLRTNAERLPE